MYLFDLSLRHTALALSLALSSSALTANPTPTSKLSGIETRVLLLGAVSSTQHIPGIAGELVLDPATMMSLVDPGQVLPDLQRRLGPLQGSNGLYYQILTVSSQPTLSAPHPLVAKLLDEAACREMAERFVARAAPDLDGWKDARVGSSLPLFRPDVKGVAYYEFAVAPRGFLIVSTGAHDIPVASFSHLSPPHSQRLVAQAGVAAAEMRIHRLSDAAYLGEASGRVVAHLGTFPFDATRASQSEPEQPRVLQRLG